LNSGEERRFGLTLGPVLLVLALGSWWRGRSAVLAAVLGLAGAALAAGGLWAPGRLQGVYRAWMGLARMLSRLTTPVVLGAAYLGVFAVMGALMRMLGRNALSPPRARSSLWVSRSSENDRRSNSMERQF
jgi:hypothetical protein